jgi:hypothetical protein
VSAFSNYLDAILPDFLKGGASMETVMKFVALAFKACLIPLQAVIGTLTVAYDAMSGVVQGAIALGKALTGDLVGAAKAFEKSKENFTNIEKHATSMYSKIKSGWTDAFVNQPKKDSEKAALAAETAEEKRQRQILAAQRKAQAEKEEDDKKAKKKQESEDAKQRTKDETAHKKHLEDVNKANEDALKKLHDLEDEAFVSRIKDEKARDIVRLQQKAERALTAVQESLATEELKAGQEKLIKEQLVIDIAKIEADYREKKKKADEDTANRAREVNAFIRQQEAGAIASYYDFLELGAKGHAKQLAQIKKDRLDAELTLTKDKIQQEAAAEAAKATKDITDKELLGTTLAEISNRYRNADVLAEAKTADEKKKIDEDLHKVKTDRLKSYSDMFASLLKGDVTGFLNAAQTMVKGHQEAWQKKLTADMGSYQMGADMAQQAVSFLNDLAQKKADKAIALAQKERDEKVALLENEMSVTESLITSSSNYVTSLKTAETSRLTELQQILTSETTSEEQKRDALKKYYSEQLQQMKAAEESKIMELQKLANLAKTDDEKRAIEAKIALAKKESEEKIRLATEETEAKAQMIDELKDFTQETNAKVLKDAQAASDKQIEIAEDEVVTKTEFKADLEETIAAENRKARTTEIAEKKKAWQAQKKADIASALITGALAVLKALANFFPLNIVLAAVAAVVTGVQIAKIKSQPEPSFRHGGYFQNAGYLQGGKHGAKYGDGGIAFVDRRTGNEVGEAEDGEAYIMSNEITKHHKPVLDQIIYQSVNRQPGPLKLNGASTMMRDGSMMNSSNGNYSHYVPSTPYWEKKMMLFGSKKRKAAQAANEANIEAYDAQKKADEAAAASAATSSVSGDSGNYGADTSGYGGVDSTDPSTTGDTAGAQAAHEKAEKQGEESVKTQKAVLANSEKQIEALKQIAALVGELKGEVGSVRQAVNGVEGAVNNSNQSGRMDSLIGAVSAMGGK